MVELESLRLVCQHRVGPGSLDAVMRPTPRCGGGRADSDERVSGPPAAPAASRYEANRTLCYVFLLCTDCVMYFCYVKYIVLCIFVMYSYF